MEIVECGLALQKLLDSLENKGAPAEVEAAIVHAQNCPYCRERLSYLVPALKLTAEDELSCGGCEELLPEYLAAVIEGEASGPRWRRIAQHLTTCPYCAAEYQTLSELAAPTPPAPVGPSRPKPDLSFLQAEPAPSGWHWDQWGRLIVQLSAQLFQGGPAPILRTAGLRAPGPVSQSLGQVTLNASEDLEVIITAEAPRRRPSARQLTIQVNIPSRGGWPHLAGTEVTLKQGDQILAVQETDAHGETIFENIAAADLPQLIFEIVPGQGGA